MSSYTVRSTWATAARHRLAMTPDPAWPTPSSRYTLLFFFRTRSGVIDTGSSCGYNSHQARTAGWLLRFERRWPTTTPTGAAGGPRARAAGGGVGAGPTL